MANDELKSVFEPAHDCPHCRFIKIACCVECGYLVPAEIASDLRSCPSCGWGQSEEHNNRLKQENDEYVRRTAEAYTTGELDDPDPAWELVTQE